MKKIYFLLSAIFFAGITVLNAQTTPAHPTEIINGKFLGLSKALRDLPRLTADEWTALKLKAQNKQLNESLKLRFYPFAATALPKGEDPAWQKTMGSVKSMTGTIQNFEGQESPYYPPDCNGTAGPNHFMQTINTVYAIYDKTGVLKAGPTNMNLIFGSVPGSNYNDGDPIILYDGQADRWVATEFSISGAINYVMMAISTTNDPTGTWYQYSFQVASMPDYPKFGVWRDGYYMGDNNGGNNDTYVFERSKMLSGLSAQAVAFSNSWRPTSVDGFMCVPPLDNDGPFAPAGSPGMYIAFNDDALGGGTDQLWLYELAVDWTTPSASTFNRTQQLDVQPFSADFGPNWNNISQKGTGQKVDGIPQVIMNVPQYRNFGSYQSIVCCHTVNVDGNGHAGIRWYELRKTGTGPWSIRQQGTYAPDANNRWMGSIMLNGHNKIALGFSISSSTLNPGIRYAGQSPGEYSNASGILDIAEDTIQNGSYSQTGANRWGDYSLMSIDPTDDETFWFTSEYIGNGGSRLSKIASFKFITGPTVVTLAATGLTGSSATLNGSLNPQGLSTDYHFDYGTIPFNLNYSTPVVTVGADTATLHVNADISSLLSNKKYYFRLVGVNTGGTISGATLNFTTPNAPTLSVTPPNQVFPPPADSTHYTVTSNTTWTVVSNSSWCMVTPIGTGNGTITAIFTENTGATQRDATITVTVDGVSPQVVTLTQEGTAPMLSVTPPNRNVESPSGNTDFTVTSNTNWTVTADSSWCTVTPSGSGNGTITANFTENLMAVVRVAHITASAPSAGTQVVTVTQAGAAPTLAVTPPSRNVTATAANTTFSVASNSNWTVASDAAWCTVNTSGLGNGTITADYIGNSTGADRTATISVTVASLPVQQVTVNQAKSAVGIDELSGNELQIYPNPSRGIFRLIPSSSYHGTIDASIQDLAGETILKKQFSGEKEYQVDLSSAAAGCYTIILKTENKLMVRKLIVIK